MKLACRTCARDVLDALICLIFLSVLPAGAQSHSPAHWTTGKIVEQHRLYEVRVRYPVLSGLPNAALVNQKIANLVQKQIRQYREQLDGLRSTCEKGYIKGAYSVALCSPKLVSIRFDFETYGPDAAHSLDTTIGFNYSPNRRKEIKLADLFVPGIDYSEVLSVLSIGMMPETIAEVQPTFLDSNAEPVNFHNFTLSHSGIRFYFNEYEIAPYAVGTVIADIAYDKVRQLLAAKSPVCAYMKMPATVHDDGCELTRKDLDRKLAIAAIAAYSAAIEKNPNDARAYYGRALWYKKLGRDQIAQADFKRAESIGYACSASTSQDDY